MTLLLLLALSGCRTSDDAPAVDGPGDSTPETYDTSDTSEPPAPELEMTGTGRDHGISLTVDRMPASSRLVCVADAVPDERHEVVNPWQPGGQFELLGLLADTDYDCELTEPAINGDRVGTASVRTPPLSVDTPWAVVEHVPERFSGAYTLFNLGDGEIETEPHQLLIVDPEGRLRWVFQLGAEFPDCDARLLEDGTIMFGGGQGIPPTIIALDGTELWRAPAADHAERYHHHAERMDDGTVLTMRHTSEVPPTGQGDPGQSWVGVRVERLTTEGLPGWTWLSQRAVDEGWLPVPALGVSDPWHANSVSVGDDGTTYVNLRQKHLVLALDPTGDLLWKLGKGGDFQLLDDEGNELSDEHWFYGAHNPEHHGDRILFYDNGYARGAPPAYSQVLELTLDVPNRTATRTWSWTEPGWYEPIWGDADELPDGGVLITKGHCLGCPQPDVSEIVEVDRASGLVDWRLQFDGPQWGIYRSQRIDGCSLFHHQGYCEGSGPPPLP